MSTTVELHLEEDLFDKNSPLLGEDNGHEDEDLEDDDYDDEDDNQDDEEDDESVPVPEIIPDLPAVLFYDSTSHGKRRFYKNSLKGKPEWSYTKDGAFVFENLDHLKLAGNNCKQYGYNGINVEPIK